MMDEVFDNLYVGSLETIKNQDAVQEEGITAVVRLDNLSSKQFKWGKNFNVLHRPFIDGEPIPDGVIDDVTQFIHEQLEAGETVLVHCAAGISRSSTLAIAYLIEYEGMTLAEAFGTIREERIGAYPHEKLLVSLIKHYDLDYDVTRVQNPRFIAQLMKDI